MLYRIRIEFSELMKTVSPFLVISIAVAGLVLPADPAAAEYSAPFQVVFDRMDILEDGDRGLGGAGEIYIVLMVTHRGPDCPEQECSKTWDFSNTFNAKKGDTVPLNLRSSLLDLKKDHKVTVYAGLADRDPLGLKYPSAALPISEHGPGNVRGAYSSVVKESDKFKPKHNQAKIRLYYSIVAYRPDLKLADFWTIPHVPNPGYADTILCIKVVNVGHDDSDRFHAQVFVDGIASPYSLPVMEGLPSSGPASRKEVCGHIRTPEAGPHRVRVKLEAVRFDTDLQNNIVEKEMRATRRLTYQEAWRRTRQQVVAFSREVENLGEALGLTAASGGGRAPEMLPAGFAGRRAMPPVVVTARAVAPAAPGEVVQLRPRLEKRPGRPSRPPGGMMPRGREPIPRQPSQEFEVDQQEILQMVSGLRSRCVRIQGEGRHLQYAYREIGKDGSAEAASKLIDKARYFYELGGHLDRAIRENNASSMKTYVGALRDGAEAMKRQLNVLRKFGG